MFEGLFGNNRKSLKEMMDELNGMLGKDYLGRDINFEKNSSVEKGSNENGNWTKETYTSPDGRFTYIMTTSYGDVEDFLKSKKKKDTIVDSLNKELQKSIDNEDYESAIKVRDMIKQLSQNKEEIEKLNSELKVAITTHNFERAIEIRDQLNKLKSL